MNFTKFKKIKYCKKCEHIKHMRNTLRRTGRGERLGERHWIPDQVGDDRRGEKGMTVRGVVGYFRINDRRKGRGCECLYHGSKPGACLRPPRPS